MAYTRPPNYKIKKRPGRGKGWDVLDPNGVPTNQEPLPDYASAEARLDEILLHRKFGQYTLGSLDIDPTRR